MFLINIKASSGDINGFIVKKNPADVVESLTNSDVTGLWEVKTMIMPKPESWVIAHRDDAILTARIDTMDYDILPLDDEEYFALNRDLKCDDIDTLGGAITIDIGSEIILIDKSIERVMSVAECCPETELSVTAIKVGEVIH